MSFIPDEKLKSRSGFNFAPMIDFLFLMRENWCDPWLNNRVAVLPLLCYQLSRKDHFADITYRPSRFRRRPEQVWPQLASFEPFW